MADGVTEPSGASSMEQSPPDSPCLGCHQHQVLVCLPAIPGRVATGDVGPVVTGDGGRHCPLASFCGASCHSSPVARLLPSTWRSSTEALDLTPRAWGLCQTTVCGHEGRLGHLGQGHICRVVGGEVCPQLPDPSHEWSVADSLEIEVCEVCDGNGCSAFIKQSSERRLPDNSNDVKIEQLRRRETLTPKAFAGAIGGIVGQSGRNDRRVNDDQPESGQTQGRHLRLEGSDQYPDSRSRISEDCLTSALASREGQAPRQLRLARQRRHQIAVDASSTVRIQ